MDLIRLFSGFPRELAVVLLATMPVGELRVAIPVGVVVYHLPLWETFLLAQIGNLFPVVVIYALCEWWVQLMERHRGWLHKLTDAVLQHTREKMHDGVIKWGLLAVVAFVAVPLPGFGAWTGTLGAFLLNIPFKKAMPYIVLGNIIAGLIVIALTAGGTALAGSLR
jgi:uncharacterized membrane protein